MLTLGFACVDPRPGEPAGLRGAASSPRGPRYNRPDERVRANPRTRERMTIGRVGSAQPDDEVDRGQLLGQARSFCCCCCWACSTTCEVMFTISSTVASFCIAAT